MASTFHIINAERSVGTSLGSAPSRGQRIMILVPMYRCHALVATPMLAPTWCRLALMKHTAMIINVSRGGLVDTDALLDALQNGRFVTPLEGGWAGARAGRSTALCRAHSLILLALPAGRPCNPGLLAGWLAPPWMCTRTRRDGGLFALVDQACTRVQHARLRPDPHWAVDAIAQPPAASCVLPAC